MLMSGRIKPWWYGCTIFMFVFLVSVCVYVDFEQRRVFIHALAQAFIASDSYAKEVIDHSFSLGWFSQSLLDLTITMASSSASGQMPPPNTDDPNPMYGPASRHYVYVYVYVYAYVYVYVYVFWFSGTTKDTYWVASFADYTCPTTAILELAMGRHPHLVVHWSLPDRLAAHEQVCPCRWSGVQWAWALARSLPPELWWAIRNGQRRERLLDRVPEMREGHWPPEASLTVGSAQEEIRWAFARTTSYPYDAWDFAGWS